MSSQITHKLPLPVLGHVGVSLGKLMAIWGGYTTAGEVFQQDFVLQMEPYVDPGLVWVYDSEYDEWSPVTTKGDIPLGTSGAGAQVIGHYMYVYGGYTSIGNRSDLYRLDINNMTWEHLDCEREVQPSPRDKFMHWSYEAKLYVFGGFGIPTGGYLSKNGSFVSDESLHSVRGWNNQLFIYDTEKYTWSNPKCTGSVPSPRAAGATARVDHHLYLFGGRHDTTRLNDLYVLNLHTMEWTRLHTDGLEPCGRSWHTFTSLSDSLIALYGGYSQDQRPLNDLWLFDVEHTEWKAVASRREYQHRLWHTACLTESHDLVIFGGCSNDILSEDHMAQSHNESFVIRFTPHPLLRLCLDASFKYRDKLGEDFESLPTVLHMKLQRRLKSFEEDTNKAESGQAKTCAIS